MKKGKFDISLWKRVIGEKQKMREERRRKTLSSVQRKLTRYFADKKVKRVFLIGSILKPGQFFIFSDLDIVVEGLKEDYFKTLSQLENLLSSSVDLIEFKSLRWKKRVEEAGIRIK